MKKIMKEIFGIFIAIISIIAMTTEFYLTSNAFENKDYGYELTGNKIIITRYKRTPDGTITIPNVIDGKEVSEIGVKSFYGMLCLNSSVVVSENITKIDDYAFAGLCGVGMNSIYLPKSIKYIGDYSIGYTYYPAPHIKDGCIIKDYVDYPVKIYGYSNTVAKTYAEKNGFDFIALDNQMPTTTTVTTSELTITTISTTITTTKPTTTKTTSTTITETTTTHVKSKNFGDTSGDGRVDSVDATFVLKDYAKILAGKKSTLSKSIADVNGDGRINSMDATIILRYYAASLVGKAPKKFEDFVKATPHSCKIAEKVV